MLRSSWHVQSLRSMGTTAQEYLKRYVFWASRPNLRAWERPRTSLTAAMWKSLRGGDVRKHRCSENWGLTYAYPGPLSGKGPAEETLSVKGDSDPT